MLPLSYSLCRHVEFSVNYHVTKSSEPKQWCISFLIKVEIVEGKCVPTYNVGLSWKIRVFTMTKQLQMLKKKLKNIGKKVN